MSTYKKAGVDINLGNQFIDIIKQKTKKLPYAKAIGGFAGLYQVPFNKDWFLSAGTDGVGTKLKLAFLLKKHDTIGVDLVAMCVNDLIVNGATPLFFLDYYATGKLNLKDSSQIMDGIVEGCKQSSCALLGGETAEMPGFYQKGEYDLAGFAVGMVHKKDIICGKDIKEGNVILGLKSSGFHSNGYSLVRNVFKGAKLKKYAKQLLTPTKIYVKDIEKAKNILARKGQKILGISHITGGGLLENIPRVLPKNVDAIINTKSWTQPKLMKELATLGKVKGNEMYKTFNMGIGMVLIVKKSSAKHLLKSMSGIKEIGYITKGKRKVILK
ncbi:MAG: phosphoribosylformylglycinamidine cyclo-ligase [Elusimicrobiaceae bacterium]|jgi:phosphoribosylformylglycinamidine cyclo-ligase|nr:phosphoribosylformylglycinamidine cyclo-ligase [Elusimicrobiaceae bacterium]MBT3955113.1 phosphoribosylformylglycinamidine cyclo-ligase [Elusimicrobiaceae bacterium]MBT4008020.1 phosphoribosylformylglycinamidine cyclo-ligase [Elusimicrobiaceae bacterium]MBT4403202.1 phosphoribosylformylglycinamidine cyclo-ligase [Elusimicrobiaceae bacterium]MBT4440357.1 phosphoribosylformylglycinamidine cyclo-ligase [Elusimicrobiaceae bacterium]